MKYGSFELNWKMFLALLVAVVVVVALLTGQGARALELGERALDKCVERSDGWDGEVILSEVIESEGGSSRVG